MACTAPPVGLLLDNGRLRFAGGDVVAHPAPWESHQPRSLQRPQAVTRAGLEFLAGGAGRVFTVPGDGCIDFGAFAQVLGDIGYAGWVVVEA